MGERRIYAMQIYQRVTPPFLLTLKKWMKFFSRIDFSALATEEEDVLSILMEERVVDILDLEEHGVLWEY